MRPDSATIADDCLSSETLGMHLMKPRQSNEGAEGIHTIEEAPGGENKLATNSSSPSDEQTIIPATNFSVFTVAQKRAIVLSGSLIGLLSPMSGTIYYPALNSVCYLLRNFSLVNHCFRLQPTSTLAMHKSTLQLRHT